MEAGYAYGICHKNGARLALRGMHEASLTHYDAAIAIDPDMDLAHYAKGESLRALGRYGEALECLDRALGAKPKKHTGVQMPEDLA